MGGEIGVEIGPIADARVQIGSQPGRRTDPLGSYRFRVRIDGLEVAEFSECSGLEMTVKFEEVREGGQNEFVHRLPGRVEYGNLTLRRGYAKSNQFFTWCLTVFNRRKIQRKKVVVALVAQDGKQVMEWTFLDAYPVKWSGPAFKAGENAIAIESLELAHRGLLV